MSIIKITRKEQPYSTPQNREIWSFAKN